MEIIKFYTKEKTIIGIEKAIIGAAKKQLFLPVTVNRQLYYIHPLIAYFLLHLQSGKKITNYPKELRTFEKSPDDMMPRKTSSEDEEFSVFSLCQNNTDSELMFQALMHVNNYTTSPDTEYFMRSIRPELKVDANMTLCVPCIPPLTDDNLEQEIMVASKFLFLSKAPSASYVLMLMSRHNLIALSLWAICAATKKMPVVNNTLYLIPEDYLRNELHKEFRHEPKIFQRLSPVFKILYYLLKDEPLEDILTTNQVRELIHLMYPPGKQSLIPRELAQKITKYLLPMYHVEIIKGAITKPHANLSSDIDVSSPYLNDKQRVKLIINSAIKGLRLTEDMFKSVNRALLYEVLDKRFEIGPAYDHVLLFSNLIKYVNKGFLEPDFLDGISCLNQREHLSLLFSVGEYSPLLFNYLMTLPEFIPYLLEAIRTGANIQSHLHSVLSENQYLRFLSLLDSDRYKKESQQIKVALLCFYGRVLEPKHQEDLINQAGQLSIESLDSIILKIEQGNTLLFAPPVSHQAVSLLLEKNPHACNLYYLSGLRNPNHSNRVKWLHLYGFKVDLSFIELALKQKPVKGKQLTAFKHTLSSIKEKIKACTSQNKYKQIIITPFDDQLENILINMAKCNPSQIASSLPNQNDLHAFDDCAIHLLSRLGIAKANQSVRRFCRQTRATNPAYTELSDTDVLKIKLTTLFETPSEERVMLCLLAKAEPMFCETLLHLYAWSIYDPQYQISVVDQIYDLLVDSLNQTEIDRDCVAFSLKQSRQLKELEAQTSSLYTKVADMSQLLRQQSQMLAQLLDQTPKSQEDSKRQSRFFAK